MPSALTFIQGNARGRKAARRHRRVIPALSRQTPLGCVERRTLAGRHAQGAVEESYRLSPPNCGRERRKIGSEQRSYTPIRRNKTVHGFQEISRANIMYRSRGTREEAMAASLKLLNLGKTYPPRRDLVILTEVNLTLGSVRRPRSSVRRAGERALLHLWRTRSADDRRGHRQWRATGT